MNDGQAQMKQLSGMALGNPYQPSVLEQLKARKDSLEETLKSVNASIEYLESNPEMATFLKNLRAAGVY